MADGTVAAAWVQAIGSIAGVLIAIYVPVRMRRVEEYDRRRDVVSTISQLKRMGDEYVRALTHGTMAVHAGVPPPGFRALEQSLRVSLVSGVPAELIPAAVKAADAAKLVVEHWELQASSGNTANPALINTAQLRQANVVRALADAQIALRRWKRSHRITLWFA